MLSLPDYMRRVDTKLEPANVIGSFLAAKKYTSDEAYRKGQSELAKQQFESNEKYRSQQMDLQKQEFEAGQKDKVINLQREQFNNLTARLKNSNLPFEEKERLINQQFDSMKEFKEALGNSRPILTGKERTVFENSGILTKETLDKLSLPPDQRAVFEPYIDKQFTATFALNPDGGATLIGSPKFTDVKIGKDAPDAGNFTSVINSLLRRRDPITGELIHTPEEAVTIAKKIMEGYYQDKEDPSSTTDTTELLPQELNQEQDELELEDADIVSDIKEATGANPILYKKYQKEYELLDFLRRKIQEDSESSPRSNKKVKSTQKENENDLLEFNSEEEAMAANLKPDTIVLINGREARINK